MPEGYGLLRPPAGGTDGLYDADYWAEYCRRDATPIGNALTRDRIAFVKTHAPPAAGADVGIGGGAYVTASGGRGADVNPYAINWLRARNAEWDREFINHLTFWDSLEHIQTFGGMLTRAQEYVFLSTPVYTSKEDCLKSKHFKPGEHIWYFSDEGIKFIMRQYELDLVAQNRMEEDHGREAIGTYCFKRRSKEIKAKRPYHRKNGAVIVKPLETMR
jgi:hypothetical protein